MKDYYQILEISRNANSEEVKKAYRKLAVKYHPDKNDGNKQAEERFKDINEAYRILSNHKKRYYYDNPKEAYTLQYQKSYLYRKIQFYKRRQAEKNINKEPQMVTFVRNIIVLTMLFVTMYIGFTSSSSFFGNSKRSVTVRLYEFNNLIPKVNSTVYDTIYRSYKEELIAKAEVYKMLGNSNYRKGFYKEALDQYLTIYYNPKYLKGFADLVDYMQICFTKIPSKDQKKLLASLEKYSLQKDIFENIPKELQQFGGKEIT